MRIGRLNLSWERLKDGTWFNYEERKRKAVWSTEADLEYALCHPVLSTLINIRADYLSKVKIFEADEEGQPLAKSSFNDLISNPNPYQSYEDLLRELEWMTLCYGWVYQRPYGGEGLDPSAIYNLSTPRIDFKEELKRSLIFRSEEASLNKFPFTYKDIDTDISMVYGDIIPFYDLSNGINGNPLTAPSRISAIRKQADNINIASEAENIMAQGIGREILFKVPINGSLGGVTPLDKKDKDSMEQNFGNYGAGTGGKRTVILNKEMGWKSLNIPHSELGIKDIIEVNSNLIAQNLQVPNEIYKAYTEGDTFENKKQAEVMFIQNVMQARADNIASSWGSYFDKNIIASYEHLPSMQIIESQKADKALKLSQAIRNLTQSGYDLNMTNDFLISNGINNQDNG